jgi:mono/diheme cytochrome c family protein
MQKEYSMTRNATQLLAFSWAFALVLLAASGAQAYDRYKNDTTGTGNCSTCHGDFTDGTSPLGTVFPGNNKHTMHRSSSYMNTECNLCHTSSDGRNPFIGSSDGTNDNPGLGCVGCHGRAEDAGNDSVSAGLGAGLRQHHTNAGLNDCIGCHTDASPALYTPVGEDIMPTYYATVDTNADDPCNPDATANLNENWSVDDFIGLDNDGDLLYDTADLVDCPEPGEALLLAVGATVLGGLSRRRKQ